MNDINKNTDENKNVNVKICRWKYENKKCCKKNATIAGYCDNHYNELRKTSQIKRHSVYRERPMRSGICMFLHKSEEKGNMPNIKLHKEGKLDTELFIKQALKETKNKNNIKLNKNRPNHRPK